MIRTPILAVSLLLLAAAAPRAQREAPPAEIDLVELDVVVVDGKGNPIRGLQQSDFTVKEDGDRVELTTFEEISSIDDNREDDARLLVLVLDDAGVPAQGTLTIQTIAKGFLASLRPGDEVAVIRLGTRNDEAYGDRETAESRIANFRATFGFQGWITVEQALERFALLTEELSVRDQRRKVVVCIGSPAVCNISEPARFAPRSIFPLWIKTLASASRANAAFYAVVPGRARLRGGGLVDFTGGELFATSYDVGPAIDRIVRDAGNHYVLGYWPKSKAKELHSIDVKVGKRGAKVRVRHRRG